jgi:phage-related protein
MAFEIVYFDAQNFRANFKHLSQSQLMWLSQMIFQELQSLQFGEIREGLSKALGKGLFELRLQKNPELLIRVFWAYALDSRIVILDGYDKKRDSSKLTQQRHISRSRSRLDAFRDEEYRK